MLVDENIKGIKEYLDGVLIWSELRMIYFKQENVEWRVDVGEEIAHFDINLNFIKSWYVILDYKS